MKCLECNEDFENERGLHIHLKKHKMFQGEYYAKHFPRNSLLYGRQIPFFNRKDYFEREFVDSNEMNLWFRQVDQESAKEKIRKILKTRVYEKGLIYGLSHIELKSLELPSIKVIKTLFGGYSLFCKELGLKGCLFEKPLPKDLEVPPLDACIIVDTREQDPLPFKNTRVEKLLIGDYLLDSKSGYTYTFVDRKSENDFIGTLNTANLERFEREIQKAAELDSYLYVVVEGTIESTKETCKRFKRMVNYYYAMKNMRELMHKYPRRVQFIFAGDRKKSQQIIPKLLWNGRKLWNVDVQYFLDNKTF